MNAKWKTAGLITLGVIVVSLFISNLYVVYDASERKSGYVTVGIPASPGINGDDGRNGKDGIPGRDGANGSNGQNGTNGVNGENGVNGLVGVDGLNGLNGKDGINGLDGATGPAGPSPEMRCENNMIQWKLSTVDTWTDLGRVLSCATVVRGE